MSDIGKEQKPRSSLPLIIIIFANMGLMGFIHSMRGVSFPLLRNDFSASYSEMGLLNAIMMVITVIASIAAGFYMSRFGLKRTVLTAFFLFISGVGSFYFVSNFWMAVGFFVIFASGYGFFEVSLNGTGARIFTGKSGLMMNLMHFFYGVGAICGPRFMGFMINNHNMSWKEAYPIALVPVIIFLIASIIIRFPGRIDSSESKEEHSFWNNLKDPLVWHFGIIMGIASSIEACSVAWSGLYLQDVYGLDPTTVGAAFISTFYILFTASRLLSGFVIEKTGYLRSIFVSSNLILIIFTVAFVMGKTGVNLLPVTGFFIAIFWPTTLAISIKVFKERAQTASSAIICISFTFGAVIQYGFGFLNRFIGAAWGYRSCVLYSIILVVLLFMLMRKNKLYGWELK
jgi:fucose permease